MNFYQFALNNLKRSKTRSILTFLSVMVTTVTLCLVLSLDKGYRSAVNEQLVKKTGAHLYITREGCPMAAASVIAQGGISPLYVSEDNVNKLKDIEDIEVIMPFNIFAITTPDGQRTDIFIGVTEDIQKIRPSWEFAEGNFPNDENSVALGDEIARLEQRKIGDKVYFEQFDKEFVVSGILKRNYSQDDGIFFFPIKVAQKLINREGKLSAIAIKLKDIRRLSEVKNIIRSMLPEDYNVITSEELGEGVIGFFGSTKAIMFIMVFLTFLISIFGIINTMLMTINERKKELAYLKCIGAGFFDITYLISLETLIICLFGSISGLIVGVLSTSFFENFIRKFLVGYLPPTQIVRVDIGLLLFSFVIVILVGIFSAFYPAVKAATIVPMEALRNE